MSSLLAPFAQVVGLISGSLSIYNFEKSQLPEDKPGNGDSVVRIAVALNSPKGFKDGLTQADGDAPKILAYNEMTDFVGQSVDDNGRISSGGFKDITVHQEWFDRAGQQPTYIQVAAGNDAVCIAYISQTWPDGTHRGWLGDMGLMCNEHSWYYSNIIVGEEHHKPACVWIDADHSYGSPNSALQIHMEDFTKSSFDQSHPTSYYCSYPAMVFKQKQHGLPRHLWIGQDDKLLPSIPPDRPAVVKRDGSNNTLAAPPRESQPRPKRRLARRNDGSIASALKAFVHLVASPHLSHSARTLCESPTSHGPDFVSLSEGVFCDMETKTQWPVCRDGGNMADCYHWETHSLITGTQPVARKYTHVDHWD